MKTCKLLLISILFLAACASKKSVVTASQGDAGTIKVRPEAFDKFILRFLKDTVFRVSRIEDRIGWYVIGKKENEPYNPGGGNIPSSDWKKILLPENIDFYKFESQSEREAYARSEDNTKSFSWKKDYIYRYSRDIMDVSYIIDKSSTYTEYYLYSFEPTDSLWFLKQAVIKYEKREETRPDPNTVYKVAEINAEPQGGYPAFDKYLKTNLIYPGEAKRKKSEGKVYLEFIVETDGTLTNIKTINQIKVGNGCEDEAIRLIKQGPKWIAGQIAGNKIRQLIILPVTFKIEG